MNWLRPMVYVQNMGGLRGYSIYPPPPCPHNGTCDRCGQRYWNDDDEGTHYCRELGLCEDCNELLRPLRRPGLAARLFGRLISVPYERLKWWYGLRYGRHVSVD